MMGSPLYMSPEQLKLVEGGRRAHRHLGARRHPLRAPHGARPFEAETVTQLTAMVLQDAPRRVDELRPDVPPGLARVIARCLEKDPAMRYANVAELARALEPFGSQRGVSLRIAQVAGSARGGAESAIDRESRDRRGDERCAGKRRSFRPHRSGVWRSRSRRGRAPRGRGRRGSRGRRPGGAFVGGGDPAAGSHADRAADSISRRSPHRSSCSPSRPGSSSARPRPPPRSRRQPPRSKPGPLPPRRNPRRPLPPSLRRSRIPPPIRTRRPARSRQTRSGGATTSPTSGTDRVTHLGERAGLCDERDLE